MTLGVNKYNVGGDNRESDTADSYFCSDIGNCKLYSSNKN